ncbi:putative 15-hydroxyprostaglandin dehydrogenase [Apostichopus japonicus]|uniref:15-hydroxyprostaglandin dehydrogenase [NAD(+)] n=1 Tax=Stichopus japonicus TaxID=307972 RepID=A0A2G8K6S8_STIJA|nr:putative 15-hydroxyprostaglandin dehydrogenase [Apostichopus japonicus]
MKIEGAVALVTGGAMGIGKEVVETLLQKGVKLCNILDFNEEVGAAVAGEFQKSYGADKVNFIKCDVSSREQLQDAFKKTQASHGRLDIVCNNAGVQTEDEGNFEKSIQINLIGSMYGTLLAKDIMMKENNPPGGVIVNTASMAGILPAFYSPFYAASKHGVVGFTRSLAQHPFIKKANVRLNLICPSFVETAMVTRAREGAPILQAVVSKANIVPMSDVMKAFLMAIEDDSLTGQAIRVTPGGGVDLQDFSSQLEDIAKLNIVNT